MNLYECFYDLVKHYKSLDRTGKVKLMNPNKGENYVEKFTAYCQDLEDLGEPWTETSKQAMFVDGIKHHAYCAAIVVTDE